MQLNEYMNEAARTASWPIDKGWDYLLSALPEEVGEFSGIFAKNVRKGFGRNLSAEHRQLAIKELGDILWNVALAARELETTLESVAQANLNKLADRASRGTIIGEGDSR